MTRSCPIPMSPLVWLKYRNFLIGPQQWQSSTPCGGQDQASYPAASGTRDSSIQEPWDPGSAGVGSGPGISMLSLRPCTNGGAWLEYSAVDVTDSAGTGADVVRFG